MNQAAFEHVCGELYDELPDNIKSRFALYVVDVDPDHKYPFGYWTNMLPNAITLVYQGFKRHGDFSKAHIRRVIKHEVEHVLCGVKHSEHKV